MATQVLGDAETGDAADPGADLLDDDHQRQAEEHGPGQRVAVLGADLAVGRDAARVIVGRSRDQAGTEAPD